MRLEIVERVQPKVTTGYASVSNKAVKTCLLLLLAAADNDSSQPLFATCMMLEGDPLILWNAFQRTQIFRLKELRCSVDSSS